MCLTKSEVISDKVGVVQTTFDVGDFKHPDRDSYKSKKDDSNQMKLIIGCEKVYDKKTDCDDIIVDENGVHHYIIPHCSHCGSTNVTKHDTNLTPIYLGDGTKRYVKVKRYNCKSCGKGSQVEFKKEFKKNSGLPSKLDNIIEKLNSLHWISLRDSVKIIKLILGLDISHEYVRKARLITNDLFWINTDITAPYYVNYDVQWIPTDSGWSYFHMMVDYRTKEIIAVELTEDEEKETTEEFFKKVFFVYPKVIITDLKPGYHELINDKMGIEHQECTIHFKKALNTKIRKELNKIKNKIQGSILLENKNIKESKLKNKLNDIMEPIIEKYWSYKDAVMKTFEFDDYEESSRYIENLRVESENYPEAIRNYLADAFFNKFHSLILFKHRDFKGKIPANNNLAESKIGWCSSKYEKRKFRTDLGFFNHVLSRIINHGNI